MSGASDWLTDKRVSELDGEPPLAGEHGISCCQAIDLAADVVDHEQIAVWPVGVAHTQVGAPGMVFNGIHLKQRRAGEKAIEGIAAAEGADLHIADGAVQVETIPGMDGGEGQLGIGMVAATHAELVEMAVVVASKALEEAIHKTFALVGAVGKLMAVEVINAAGNENIAKNIER